MRSSGLAASIETAAATMAAQDCSVVRRTRGVPLTDDTYVASLVNPTSSATARAVLERVRRVGIDRRIPPRSGGVAPRSPVDAAEGGDDRGRAMSAVGRGKWEEKDAGGR